MENFEEIREMATIVYTRVPARTLSAFAMLVIILLYELRVAGMHIAHAHCTRHFRIILKLPIHTRLRGLNGKINPQRAALDYI